MNVFGMNCVDFLKEVITKLEIKRSLLLNQKVHYICTLYAPRSEN